ncbi:MAG: hypothetical protein ACREQY_24155, partial [Candidatus Binatia bacterium]
MPGPITRLLIVAVVGVASPALAQCPVLWNGDEPFTHYLDDDGNGVCNGAEEATDANGVYPNGFYPHCTRPDATPQISHGHFEYTRLHTDDAGATEEKDYLDTESDDPAGQTARFAANEPKRFERAGTQEQNPDRGFWQVDEWIGPAAGGERLPLATWTERFFECSGPLPCVDLDAAPSSGGYW